MHTTLWIHSVSRTQTFWNVTLRSWLCWSRNRFTLDIFTWNFILRIVTNISRKLAFCYRIKKCLVLCMKIHINYNNTSLISSWIEKSIRKPIYDGSKHVYFFCQINFCEGKRCLRENCMKCYIARGMKFVFFST